MVKIFSTRRNIVIAGVATAVVIGSASAAFAYFSSTGSGTGSATVGSVAALTVSPGIPDITTPLSPGGTQNVTFTVTNSGSQSLELLPAEVTASIAATGGDVFKFTGTAPNYTAVDAPGCLASWFNTGAVNLSSSPTPSSPASSYVTIAPSAMAYVTVPVNMPSDLVTNQDACEGITGPKVTIQIGQ